jgi:hypothetical protein
MQNLSSITLSKRKKQSDLEGDFFITSHIFQPIENESYKFFCCYA